MSNHAINGPSSHSKLSCRSPSHAPSPRARSKLLRFVAVGTDDFQLSRRPTLIWLELQVSPPTLPSNFAPGPPALCSQPLETIADPRRGLLLAAGPGRCWSETVSLEKGKRSVASVSHTQQACGSMFAKVRRQKPLRVAPSQSGRCQLSAWNQGRLPGHANGSNGSRAAGRNAPGDRPQTVCSSKWSRPDRNAAVAVSRCRALNSR